MAACVATTALLSTPAQASTHHPHQPDRNGTRKTLRCHTRFNFSAPKALAAALVLCLGQAASAQELIVAPYFHSWAAGSLVSAKNSAGMNSAVLAFAITKGTCALDQTLIEKLPDARTFVGAGGQLLISYGGQNGVYAEIACKDDNQLFNLMEKLMIDSGTRRFDFDIEGAQLLDTEGTARRNRVLARLQAKYSDYSVTFTLPGWIRGVNAESMNLLTTAVAAGVRIDKINVMAMSFGVENLRTMVTPSTVGQAVIMTLTASASQFMTIYRNKTQSQVYAMMGVTPMVGTNDDGATFTLDDARTVANFVKSNGIGQISYWSFQRDRAQASSGNADINNFSGVAQSDYQFHSIFKSAGGSVAPAPSAPSPSAPAPSKPAPSTPAPAPAACGASTWVMGAQYAAGSIVKYTDGKLYIASSANPGYNPTISTYYWSAYNCAGASAPTPPPAQAPACKSSNWVMGQQYAVGSVVKYSNGYLYIAKYANPGYDPTISTYFWSRYAC